MVDGAGWRERGSGEGSGVGGATWGGGDVFESRACVGKPVAEAADSAKGAGGVLSANRRAERAASGRCVEAAWSSVEQRGAACAVGAGREGVDRACGSKRGDMKAGSVEGSMWRRAEEGGPSGAVRGVVMWKRTQAEGAM